MLKVIDHILKEDEQLQVVNVLMQKGPRRQQMAIIRMLKAMVVKLTKVLLMQKEKIQTLLDMLLIQKVQIQFLRT